MIKIYKIILINDNLYNNTKNDNNYILILINYKRLYYNTFY